MGDRVTAGLPRLSARVVLVVILLAGTAIRVAYVDRPLDHRLLAAWRQSDYVQLARNFWREDPNILHPRIDWRRDGPGLVEMEFPLIPWLGGMLYRVFGNHEQILRALSAVLGVGGLLLFAGLARRLLPRPGALAAVAFYAFNPLLIFLSTAMQPEPLMLFLSLLAIVLIERWDRTQSTVTLLLAGAALGGAILAKAPAACLGFVFAFVVLRRSGIGALKHVRVWLAAVLALGPPVAWYLWARHFWVLYGNSLGMSNESPFLGLDMLRGPEWIIGLLKWQTLGVLTPLGWILLLATLRARRSATALPLVWLGSVWLMLVVSARTTAADWAFYYHALAVAPACILMGAGFSALHGTSPIREFGLAPGRLRFGLSLALAAGSILLMVAATTVVIRRRDGHEDLRTMRACGLQFASLIPPEGRIVVRGGTTVHPLYGTPAAHDKPMFFAWLDRKGFTYGDQELSLATLTAIAARGGRYWIAEPDELEGPLGREIEARFVSVDRCGSDYTLFDLQSASAGPTGPVNPVTGSK